MSLNNIIKVLQLSIYRVCIQGTFYALHFIKIEKVYTFKIKQLLWVSLSVLRMSMNDFRFQSNVSTSFTADSWSLVLIIFL